jgi:eukaryotic-like serine/threonine-protein kinase
VLLFEMLSGRLPFEADTPVAMAVAHLTKPVPPLPGTVPADVAAVVQAAMAKQPEDRPADAARMAADLRATAGSRAARRGGLEAPTSATHVLRDRQATRHATTHIADGDPPQPSRGRRRLAAAAVVIVLAGGAAAAAGLAPGGSNDGPPEAQADAQSQTTSPADVPGYTATVPPRVEQTTVPTLIGITEEGARARAERQGLFLDVRRRDSVRVPEGQVVRQTPLRGARVDKASTVRVTVADGPPPVTVPSVTGDSVSAAVAQLQARGLQVTQTTRSSARPAGTVIKATPQAGTSVEPGSTVRLVVAAAPTWKAVATHTFTASGSTGPIDVPTTARKARITYTFNRPSPDGYLVMDMYIQQPDASFESFDIKDGTHETNVGLDGSGELELQLNEYSDEGEFTLEVTVEVLG